MLAQMAMLQCRYESCRAEPMLQFHSVGMKADKLEATTRSGHVGFDDGVLLEHRGIARIIPEIGLAQNEPGLQAPARKCKARGVMGSASEPVERSSESIRLARHSCILLADPTESQSTTLETRDGIRERHQFFLNHSSPLPGIHVIFEGTPTSRSASGTNNTCTAARVPISPGGAPSPLLTSLRPRQDDISTQAWRAARDYPGMRPTPPAPLGLRSIPTAVSGWEASRLRDSTAVLRVVGTCSRRPRLKVPFPTVGPTPALSDKSPHMLSQGHPQRTVRFPSPRCPGLSFASHQPCAAQFGQLQSARLARSSADSDRRPGDVVPATSFHDDCAEDIAVCRILAAFTVKLAELHAILQRIHCSWALVGAIGGSSTAPPACTEEKSQGSRAGRSAADWGVKGESLE
ncbi:hypothetical protein C8R44DRAFT_848015, partial [Mycena epipterygia]